MAHIERWKYFCGALGILILAAQAVAAQTFRVQVNSIPAAPGTQGKAAREERPRPRVITVDIDSYVEGVLAGEASTLHNRAALETMAILARTWALRYRGRHHAQGYDFCSLTHCQVFRPARGQYPPKILDAVRNTEKLVLEYHGRLADPYFTADCGGETESAANVWPDRNEPYLISIADPYCAASAHSSWQREIPLDRIAAILREGMGLAVRGPVSEMKVASRDASGRVRALEVLAGGSYIIDANQFRYAVGRKLGWNILMSNLYKVELRGGVLVFSGHGLGHGVGLCQAGADAMAGLGITYTKILALYFPGTTIVKYGAPPKSASDPIASSEHFELAYPEEQGRWVNRTLNQLESWRRVLAQYAVLNTGKIRVETWNSTAEFIRATGEPGWVAGTSDGKSIFLQPLATLASKGILESTLRHELTHIVLHRLRAPGVPDWFEEGFALYLTGEPVGSKAGAADSGVALGQALAHPKSADEMHTAYAHAAKLVHDLAERRGQQALWQMLEHPTSSDLEWLKKQGAGPMNP